MKTKVIILASIGIILTFCTPKTETQEFEVATEVSVTKTPVTQEPVATEAPAATKLPTEAPTELPPACVTLLTPENGADLPVTGKVTFSWTPMNEAGRYVINFILPSGSSISFETDQTFRDRYMEAFVTGGEYQWQVTAQDANGNDICISEVATFDKPAYEKPKGNSGGQDDNSGGGNGGGSCWNGSTPINGDCPPQE